MRRRTGTNDDRTLTVPAVAEVGRRMRQDSGSSLFAEVWVVWRWILALILVTAPLPGGSAAVSAPARARLSLDAGEAAFWTGPYVEEAAAGDGCGETSCWTYEVAVTERAYRLRVGIDHPEVGDSFGVEVRDPSGTSVASFSTGTGLYSSESLHRNPALGVWEIEVQAEEVTQSKFRMRVKLEARPPSLGTKRGPVLPNLQVLPPHEPSFLTPVTNGSQGDPPQGVEGAESCHPEERVEDGAVRCLRIAFGIRNTGRGPLQLYYEGSPPQEHPLFQRVRTVGDGYFDRDAGVARWHESHGHYHHGDAVSVQLFRVVDRDEGVLEAASERHRKGFAHRDELLRDWNHFYPTWDRYGFGLLAGWSDIYEWDRPGNYVDFGVNGDGYYVIRMWADPVDGILESNERDNDGYSYVRVTGREVEMLEAGRGKHPWDRCKIVVGFGGHPDPKRGARPERCPPDTT